MATEQTIGEIQSPLFPDPSISGPSSHHIAALDGLRGLAVLLVIAFHCMMRAGWTLDNADPLTRVALAGWLGVDIFFVLSGFLITGILIDTKETAHFLRNFYVRRVLRIMPVYFLLLIVTLLILPLFFSYSKPELQLVLDRQAWLWLHLSNVGFVYYGKAWLLADWLDLSHLWSLAVEEQFYLFWPFFVWRLRPRYLAMACCAGIILPVLFRVGLWAAGQSAGSMYFATPCRVDGLALGALMALTVRFASPATKAHALRFLAISGGIGLVALAAMRGGLWFSDKPAVAFASIFVNFLTAAAILSVIRTPGLARRLLENRFLKFSGKYSYGLYLWHPLIVSPIGIAMFDGQALSGRASYGSTLIFALTVLAASFFVALVSFHAFESYFLRFKARFHAK